MAGGETDQRIGVNCGPKADGFDRDECELVCLALWNVSDAIFFICVEACACTGSSAFLSSLLILGRRRRHGRGGCRPGALYLG